MAGFGVLFLVVLKSLLRGGQWRTRLGKSFDDLLLVLHEHPMLTDAGLASASCYLLPLPDRSIELPDDPLETDGALGDVSLDLPACRVVERFLIIRREGQSHLFVPGVERVQGADKASRLDELAA